MLSESALEAMEVSELATVVDGGPSSEAGGMKHGEVEDDAGDDSQLSPPARRAGRLAQARPQKNGRHLHRFLGEPGYPCTEVFGAREKTGDQTGPI